MKTKRLLSTLSLDTCEQTAPEPYKTRQTRVQLQHNQKNSTANVADIVECN